MTALDARGASLAAAARTPHETRLPTSQDIIDPDFTGGLSPEEYLRRQRGGSDTMDVAEARREGYARGYDEASRRSGARIAELEREVGRLTDTAIRMAQAYEPEERDAYARGAAAMREAAADACDDFLGWVNAAEKYDADDAAWNVAVGKCLAAIRALPLPDGEGGEQPRTALVRGRVTGAIHAGDQAPGMPEAICHACGLGRRCHDADCPNAEGGEG